MPNETKASHSETPLPDWYQLYFAAVLEADDSKTVVQIGRACKAIEDRLSELRCGSLDNPHEVQDLNCALTYLRLLLQNINAEGTMPDGGRHWASNFAWF